MRRHLLALAVILTGATGCDNVAWGGTDVRLTTPGSPIADQADTLPVGQVSAQGPAAEVFLLSGSRNGSRATLSVVGKVVGAGLAPISQEVGLEDSITTGSGSAGHRGLEVGSEWILFSEGVRVGRMRVDELGEDASYCGPGPTLSGVVELIPDVATAERLLALPAEAAGDRGYAPYREHAHTYDQRVASLSIAGELVPRLGAPWPPTGMLGARQDIQAFLMPGDANLTVAATFTHRDGMDLSTPASGAYSLFILAGAGPEGYGEAFSWYRPAEEGKGVSRFFDHLDLDGDGAEEVILDVLGAGSRWYATLARRNGTWVRTFQSPCGEPAVPPGG